MLKRTTIEVGPVRRMPGRSSSKKKYQGDDIDRSFFMTRNF